MNYNNNTENKSYCSKCNNPIRTNDKFCSSCGSILNWNGIYELYENSDSLQSTVKKLNKCPNCNSEILEKQNVCKYCGSQIKGLDSESKTNIDDDKMPIIKIIGVLIGAFIILINLNIIKNPFSTGNKKSNSYNYIDSEIIQTAFITFCKKVDNNLNAIEPGSIFNHRKKLYIRLESNKLFKTPYIYLYVYIMNGNSFTFINKFSFEIDPGTNIFAIPYIFNISGKYRVVFRKNLSDNFAVSTINIR